MTLPRPYALFVLAFALSLPFWVFGFFVDRQLLPGLPASALMVLAPVAAAGLLVFRNGGAPSLARLLGASFDWRRMKPWACVVAVATMPFVMALSGAWLVATGQDLPPVEICPADLALLFILFFVAATAEEIGWTGYASRPLVYSHGLFLAGAILGCVVVLWHVLPLIQAGRSWDWIAWWALGTFARRFIILAIYFRGGGSVFAASLFHAMNNVSWMAFPVLGSHYYPPSVSVISACFAMAVLIADREALTPASVAECSQGEQNQ